MKEEEDQSLNAAPFANLIDALYREAFTMRRSHGASRVVYILRNRRFVPSQVSYESIVHRLCKERSYPRAFSARKWTYAKRKQF
ncbi:unnamed protein product [Linum trigynum]|uniref:Uncharacterized protein n=1 Tax=Linum trigynum TaxID=586398 RepID=A0AAV2FSZ9_9ROSI